MRREIPVPVAVAIVVVLLAIVGVVYWKRSSPGAQAAKSEAMIRKAFGVQRPGPSMPPSPGGTPGSTAPAPGGGAQGR